jgi:hypothetical protein
MKLDLYPKLKQLLTEDEIFKNASGAIMQGLNWPGEGKELFDLHLTIAQFKKLKGFYGSLIMMKQLSIAYPSRLLRRYAMQVDPSIIPDVKEILDELDPTQDRVALRLMEYFKEKFGEVSPERIKELDEIAKIWIFQDQEQMKNLAEGKGWKTGTEG